MKKKKITNSQRWALRFKTGRGVKVEGFLPDNSEEGRILRRIEEQNIINNFIHR